MSGVVIVAFSLIAQIAYSGWSCGGVQALQVAKDPQVKTLVIHNSGVLNNGPPP